MTQNRDKIIIIVVVGIAMVLFVVFGAFTYFFSRQSDNFAMLPIGGRVAIIDLDGVIENSGNVVRQIGKYEDDNSVKALLLRVNSPGGGVAPSQEIYDQLLKFKKTGKNVVVSMGSVAASGGYYVSCAADSILANPGTITGSIGVIFSFPVIKTLLDKVGIKMEVIKSGDLKDVGNPARDLSPEERQMLQALIDDTYKQFVGVVAESRNLDTSYVKSIANGAIFSGSQALELGLVDRLGTFEDALSLAGEMAGLGSNPRTIKEKPYQRSIFFDLLGSLGLDFSKSPLVRPWPMLEYRFSIQE